LGKIKPVSLAKLIIGAFSAEPLLFEEAKKILVDKFGPIDLTSPIWDFKQTDYYAEEMGPDLKRIFFSFERLIEFEWLPEIKTFTNELEQNYLKENGGGRSGRRLNLDPGYLTPAKLVLATTKDYSHRLYLGAGIFGEVTLHYKDGAYQSWEWTYPDYRTEEYREFFKRVRDILLTKK
jgi:hypothetical protein